MNRAESAPLQEIPNQSHPLQGLWLVRKSLHAEGIDPFSTVMDLVDSTDTQRIFRMLEQHGRRFEQDYLETRRNVEAWVRAEGKQKGLQPDTNHPLYFRVSQTPVTENPPGLVVINIPCEAVRPAKATYTFDDSFHHHAVSRGQPYPHTPEGLRPQVLTAAEVGYKLHQEGFPPELAGCDPRRYIECQVWSHQLSIYEKVREMLGAQSCREGAVVMDLTSCEA